MARRIIRDLGLEIHSSTSKIRGGLSKIQAPPLEIHGAWLKIQTSPLKIQTGAESIQTGPFLNQTGSKLNHSRGTFIDSDGQDMKSKGLVCNSLWFARRFLRLNRSTLGRRSDDYGVKSLVYLLFAPSLEVISTLMTTGASVLKKKKGQSIFDMVLAKSDVPSETLGINLPGEDYK